MSMYATYHLITVVQLQHHIRRVVAGSLRVSIDFNVLKDKSLIPRGVQSGCDDLCGLTHMKE